MMSDLIPPNKTWTAQGYVASIKKGELHAGPVDPNSMATTSVFEDYSNHLFNQVQDGNKRVDELERVLTRIRAHALASKMDENPDAFLRTIYKIANEALGGK